MGELHYFIFLYNVSKVQRAPVSYVFVDDDDSQIGDRLFYRYVGNGCNVAIFEWKQIMFI